MGEVIQLQGDQRKDVQEFLVDKKEGLELDAKTIKVCSILSILFVRACVRACVRHANSLRSMGSKTTRHIVPVLLDRSYS